MPDGKVNILIVDDKPEKLLALEAVLEELGQIIVRAYSGREALRCLLNDDFAVILLDVNMPGMDGFETASLIRQRKSTEHIPIIFITAFGDDTHSSRGYSLGAVDYIQTPVMPEVLKTKVSVFVDLARKNDQVRRQADSLSRRAVQLQKLAAASVAVSSAGSINQMLQIVADSARDIIGAHQAIMLCLTDPYSGQSPSKSQAATSFSEKFESWRTKELDLKAVTRTLVAQSRTPTRMSVGELHVHPDWEIVRRLDIPPIEGGILAVPLAGRDNSNLGIIYLADRFDGGQFTHDDEAVLVQLAQMASIAVENTLYLEERETNRIKDEFLSTLSHELRTPLNAILGWTQLLRMGQLDGEVGHAIEVIERNARAQAKLVEDLLDVSRVTNGKLKLSTRPLDLRVVTQAAIDAVRPTAAAKQIALDVELAAADDAHYRLVGDADRLQQVAWNLLSNAVKFTPAGGRVSVRIERAAEAAGNSAAGGAGAASGSGESVRLIVVDSGQGIPASFLPYVFERFRQADATSTRSHGGLGIGLTLVRRIVELHGGTVTAQSAGEGQGATFTVTLPAGAAPAEGESETPAAADKNPDNTVGDAPPRPSRRRRAAAGNAAGNAAGSPAQPIAADSTELPQAAHVPAARSDGSRAADRIDLSGSHILVIDDEADAREVIAEILRRANATVTAAAGAADALAIVTQAKPDLVLSDIAMPERDGYDLIRGLRELPRELGGETPAIALTAYAREEDRIRCVSAGFQAHLSKPVAPSELLATVAHLCPRSEAVVARLKFG
jgi:signal transduction histidine kinase/DNA-binding response OmpR family regulator